jgi:hypothetical protein
MLTCAAVMANGMHALLCGLPGFVFFWAAEWANYLIAGGLPFFAGVCPN